MEFVRGSPSDEEREASRISVSLIFNSVKTFFIFFLFIV